MIWVIVIAAIILLFALFLFQMGAHIFEDQRIFFISIAAFFVLFIGAVVLLKMYMPKLAESANVSMVTQEVLDN